MLKGNGVTLEGEEEELKVDGSMLKCDVGALRGDM